jgi:hypothetical protein
LISDGNGLSHRVRADSNTIRNRALLHSEAAERSFEGEVRTGSGSEGGSRRVHGHETRSLPLPVLTLLRYRLFAVLGLDVSRETLGASLLRGGKVHQ